MTTSRIISKSEVFMIVSRITGVSVHAILGHSRSKTETCARHIAAHVLRSHCHMSYPEIGRALERDHTTIMKAIEVLSDRLRQGKLPEDDHVRVLYQNVMSGVERAANATA